MKNVTLRRWKKNDREEVRVGLSTFKGKRYFSARIWYLGEDDVFKPSSKGLNLTIDHLSELSKGISLALGKVQKLAPARIVRRSKKKAVKALRFNT